MYSSIKTFRPSLWYAVVPLLFVSGVILLFVSKTVLIESIAALVVLAAAAILAGLAIEGRVEVLVLGWVALFPLGHYFLDFPRARSLFTLNRAFIGVLIVAMLFGHSYGRKIVPKAVQKAAVAWFLFLIAVVLSARKTDNFLGACKVIVDSFVLPALLAYFVIVYFPVRRWLAAIHSLVCLMCCYSAAVGAAELLTGEDLLPLPGRVLFHEETGTLLRVNGPFAANDVFGVVGLIALCFLVFLGRVLASRFTPSQKLLHRVGMGAALAMSVMPMFRSIVLSLCLVLLVDLYFNNRPKVRNAAVVLVLLGTVSFFTLRRAAPEIFEKRVSDPSNFYSRIANHKQTLAVFLEHPINGAGFGNYNQVASELPQAYYHSGYAVGWAHNTLGAVLAETGLTGFVPYVFAQIYLFSAFWKLHKVRSSGVMLASACFICVFVAYWFNGVFLTNGYDPDLNCWYLFVTAAVYKFAITDPALSRAQPTILPQRKWAR